ncbi:MAG TPA: methyltransferase [Steroidobacteraceae bacterium]|jgi:release factor glutamine methyltransferase|nr:methyltransferase [Steroidobacteraceae bacterium]
MGYSTAGTRALVKLLYISRRLRGLHRYDDFVVERVHGVPILVTPSVFNPKRLRTGEFFASRLDSALIGPDAEVLDMGTGSGVCAVFAARHARRVVAVDINAAAARCATINAQLNRLEDKIEVHHGDLFQPVDGQRFDLILFNPPFRHGEPRDDRDRAWRSIGVAERFADGLDRHLKRSGCALLLLSTYAEHSIFLSPLQARGHRLSEHAEGRYFGERLTLYRVAPLAAPGAI